MGWGSTETITSIHALRVTDITEEESYFGSLDDFHTNHDEEKLLELRKTVDAMTPSELKRYENYRRSTFQFSYVEQVRSAQRRLLLSSQMRGIP